MSTGYQNYQQRKQTNPTINFMRPQYGTVGINGLTSRQTHSIVQELCESRGGRPELSVLTSLLVSVDVKNY